MKSDMISWFFFEIPNTVNKKRNGIDDIIPEDADISIESSFFIYNVFSSKRQNEKITASVDEMDDLVVIIDELYRPGMGVNLKRNHYGAWNRNINIDASDILAFMESTYTNGDTLDDYNPNFTPSKSDGEGEANLIVDRNEKWERRKDLTGILLKTTTNAV